MRCQDDDINTEHNMKSIGSAAVAQWTKRLTRNGQTRESERRIFCDITILYSYIEQSNASSKRVRRGSRRLARRIALQRVGRVGGWS